MTAPVKMLLTLQVLRSPDASLGPLLQSMLDALQPGCQLLLRHDWSQQASSVQTLLRNMSSSETCVTLGSSLQPPAYPHFTSQLGTHCFLEFLSADGSTWRRSLVAPPVGPYPYSVLWNQGGRQSPFNLDNWTKMLPHVVAVRTGA